MSGHPAGSNLPTVCFKGALRWEHARTHALTPRTATPVVTSDPTLTDPSHLPNHCLLTFALALFPGALEGLLEQRKRPPLCD